MSRLATAPISWGICEVPGWGLQLPVRRVLTEMSQVGFSATELGSEGYLPSNPSELRSILGTHDLTLLAAFVPLVLHDVTQARESLKRAEAMATLLAEGGARYFNTAAVTSWDWAPRRTLSGREWTHAMDMFEQVEAITSSHGLEHVLHEHVGTIIETREEIERVLESSSIRFVLDTAHLAIGGYDPVDFANEVTDRVGLVHIKDADLGVAARLNAGEISLMQAVQAGIFPPVGRGDLDIDAIISSLEGSGFGGWYVLEQDAAIVGDEPAQGEGPIEDVRTSVKYLRGLEERLAA